MPDASDSPLLPDAPVNWSCLRQMLAEAGFNHETIAAATGLYDRSQPLDLARVLRSTTAPTRFNTLLRLFVIGQPVPLEVVRQMLAPVPLEELLACGLLVQHEEQIRAQAMLVPSGELWTLCDFDPELIGRPAHAQHVLGIGVATQMLANLTIRRTGERVLDLGTGGGVHAFLAAEHAAHVIGTDTNPRALQMAELGARLNGLANVEFRQGSLYDPIGDEKFDLILVNPPFAVSPESRFAYRDSGMPGDALCEHIIRHAGEHLNEGGFAIVNCDWHHLTSDDWADRPMSWAANSGCDVWLMQVYSIDPASYASQWLHARERTSPLEYARRLDEWLAYYARLGIGALSRGSIVLHRRTAARNWARASHVQFQEGKCGEQIRRIFSGRDMLVGLAQPQDLLDVKLRLAPGHELRHTMVAEEGTWIVRDALLRHAEGFDFEGRVDRVVSSLLAGCDGTRTLREVATVLAADLGAPLDKVLASSMELAAMLLDKAFFEIGPASSLTPLGRGPG